MQTTATYLTGQDESSTHKPLPRLFVLNGPSGAGKSTALDLLCRTCPSSVATVFPKFRTARTPRVSEFADTIVISDAEFSRHALSEDFYRYANGSAQYGFHRAHLVEALERTRNCFVIVRDERVIRQLVADITFASVVPIRVSAPADVIRHRLNAADSASCVDERVARDTAFSYDPSLYRVEIANSGSLLDLQDAFRGLLQDLAIAA